MAPQESKLPPSEGSFLVTRSNPSAFGEFGCGFCRDRGGICRPSGDALRARQGFGDRGSDISRLRRISHIHILNANSRPFPDVLSQTVEYALRASIYIARQAPRPVRGPEIAAAVHAPRNYLGKILGQLARAGFLDSTRGPAGGFRLARHAKHQSLADIVSIFGESGRRRCLLGDGICGQNPSCMVHDRWAPIAQATTEFFARTTLAALLSSSGTRALKPYRGAAARLSRTLS